MNISILKCLYFFGFINSISILFQIIVGQTYYDARLNVTSINGTESWPAKMRLRGKNYDSSCQIPSVNIEIDEDRVINAWNLPSNCQLSPVMREIGRCHVAAEEMAKNGIYFDTDKCNCVHSWPVILFASILSGLIAIAYHYAMFLFLLDSIEDSLVLFFEYYAPGLIPFGGWSAIAILLSYKMHDIMDIDVSFTVDGNGFPQNYYGKATEWRSIFIQAFIGYFVSMAQLVICIFKMCKEDRQYAGEFVYVIGSALFIAVGLFN